MELEEQARRAAAAAASEKRKAGREARLHARREKDASPEGAGGSGVGVKDFAPPSALKSAGFILRSASSSSGLSTKASSSSLTCESLERELGHGYCEEEEYLEDQCFPQEPVQDGPSTAEYAIVSQLLVKIRELEETNAQIKEQQKLTEERMRVAQWDAESIRRVYDCLDSGDIDLEVQEEEENFADFSTPPVTSNGAIRFSSLRRTIVSDMSRSMSSDSDLFDSGITKDMHSTVRDGPRGTSAFRVRKSIVGLFDSGVDTSLSSAGWGEYPPSLRVSPSFRSGAADAWSSSATDGLALPSPSPSARTFLEPVGRTLGSELGSEIGDDWVQHGINHHLRASSLCDLANFSASSPASPTESTAPLPPIVFPTVEEQGAWGRGEPATPPRRPGLQLTIQPPTPSPDKPVRPPASVRQVRLSQTVRSRTNRWVEGRIVQMPASAPSSSQLPIDRMVHKKSSATLGRRAGSNALANIGASALVAGTGLLGGTFDQAVGQIRRVASRGSFTPLGLSLLAPEEPKAEAETREAVDDDCLPDEVADRSLSLRQDASIVDPLSGRREGVVGFVIEAWLWLQFIIVVALFLWAKIGRAHV